jgi:hypothetical protein
MLNMIRLKEIGPVLNARNGQAMANRAKKEAYMAMGRYWHVAIRPQHFTRAAMAAYGYAPRKGDPGRPDPYGFKRSYLGKKLKEHGHTRPLEKTGESMAQTRTATISASSRHVRISFMAGWLASGTRRHAIDLEDELTAINQEDADDLADTFARAADAALENEVYQYIVNL